MAEWVAVGAMIAGGAMAASKTPQARSEPTLQAPVTQLGTDSFGADEASKRRRKLRGPMMALADEDLRLSIAGKQQLGA